MYICICKRITDSQIRKAVRENGITRVRHLYAELGACKQCGKCARDANLIIKHCLEERLQQEENTLDSLSASLAT